MNYETAQDVFDALCMPFASEEIDWRIGNTKADKTQAMALAYLDARTVMDRLDGVCGPDGWQCNYTPIPGHPSIICNLGIQMPGSEWLWKADGAGASDIEAEKGMMSDALKRAAVRWGVGRYLYDLDSPWVSIEPAGRSFRIVKTERKKLDEVHDAAAQKVGWGGPTNVAAYRFLVRVVQQTVTQASEADEFREKYKSMFPLLRVAMRRHLENLLDMTGAPSHKQAAE